MLSLFNLLVMFLLTKQNPWRWIATNGYLQRIFWGPVDGCVDQTASTVIDKKTKEEKENGVHDCNFQIGDDPTLIRSANMLMYCCLQLLTGLGQRLSRASVSLHSLTFLKGWFQVVCSAVKNKNLDFCQSGRWISRNLQGPLCI